MKEMYLKLPEVLRKEIMIQFTLSFTAICFFFIIVIFFREFILAVPCLAFGVFMTIKGLSLYLNCIAGNYLEIDGICSKVSVTRFRKKIKNISVLAENKTLKIPAQISVKKPEPGNHVTLYISKKAKLYYTDGCYVVSDIYALLIH